MSKISQQLGLNLKELPPSISDKKGHLIIYEHPTLSNFMELSFYDNLSKGQLFNICYNTSNSVKHKNDINPIFCDFEKIRFEIKQVLAGDGNSPEDAFSNLSEIGKITGIESVENYKNLQLDHFTLHPFDSADTSKQRLHLHLKDGGGHEPITLSYDRLSADEDYLLTFVFLNSFITKKPEVKGTSAIVFGRNIDDLKLAYKLSGEISDDENTLHNLSNSPSDHNFKVFTKTNLNDFDEFSHSSNINLNTDVYKSIFERASKKKAKGVVILGSPDYSLKNNDFLYLGYIY